MAKVKCPVCSSQIDKADAVQIGRRYCCKEHEEEYRSIIAKKVPSSHASQPTESSSYKSLIEIVCTLFEIQAPTGMILKQIQAYHKTMEYTYDGMRATLIYCAKWADPAVEFDLERGIAFIPYRYDEARRFYTDVNAVKSHLATVDANRTFQRERVVEINECDLEESKHKLIKLMDISSME